MDSHACRESRREQLAIEREREQERKLYPGLRMTEKKERSSFFPRLVHVNYDCCEEYVQIVLCVATV